MYIDNLSGIVDSYDLLIVDVYGVIFDGTTLIPEAFATIASLIKAKKNLFLLSNSPRPQYVTREKIVSCMHKIGKTNQNINGLEIFTSGDMFAEFMASSISDKGKRIASPVHASSSARTNIWNASSVKNDFSFIKGRLYLLGATPEHHLIREINQRLHEAFRQGKSQHGTLWHP